MHLERPLRGLERKKRKARGGGWEAIPDSVWYVRRAVPKDLRPRLGAVVIKSTGTADYGRAEKIADTIWREWDAEFAEVRSLGAEPAATLEQVTTALDRWRAGECARAAGADVAEIARASVTALVQEVRAQADAGRDVVLGPFTVDLDAAPSLTPNVARDAAAWASSYFLANPMASRAVDCLPHEAGLRLGRLQVAVRHPEAWRDVEGFDEALDAAAKAGGLVGAIGASIRSQARPVFARALLEVEQHREAERRRAAAFLAALEATNSAAIRVAATPGAYQPREGDLTLGEVMARYTAERAARTGEADTEKDFKHLRAALEEMIGKDKPFRAITREDCLSVRAFLQRIPANAAKVYPGLSLKEAAERAAQDGQAAAERAAQGLPPERSGRRKPVKLMSPNTVRGYLLGLAGVFNWAISVGLADTNPARGLAGSKKDNVKRRGFTSAELKKLFGSLEGERAKDSAKFWVPAILAFSGARAGEVCQLLTRDVKEVAGHAYLDLSEFDDEGRRDEAKSLKNPHSFRAVPIHPQLIAAGFLEFVARRRAAGVERLFPELRPNKVGEWSADLSKWFGRHLDRLGMREASLVLHSLRHGFRDACRAVNLADQITDALGGWKTPGVGAAYGDSRSAAKVPELATHLAKVEFGFQLAAWNAPPGR
ncbi:MAG TPA: site-specific integrase [Caulobacteraceae bacterium]